MQPSFGVPTQRRGARSVAIAPYRHLLDMCKRTRPNSSSVCLHVLAKQSSPIAAIAVPPSKSFRPSRLSSLRAMSRGRASPLGAGCVIPSVPPQVLRACAPPLHRCISVLGGGTARNAKSVQNKTSASNTKSSQQETQSPFQERNGPCKKTKGVSNKNTMVCIVNKNYHFYKHI